MVTIKKFLKGLGLVIASVIVIGGCVQLYLLRGTPGRPLREADLRADTEYSTTPTLLIPGWGGSTVTYDKMINYYQSHHLGFALGKHPRVRAPLEEPKEPADPSSLRLEL